MKPKLQLGHALACCVLGMTLSPAGDAQTTPPPPAAKPSPSTPQSAPSRASTEPAKGTATVEFHNGLLHIVATDADLNAVLLQVSQLTGMRVQGATNGDRLYGDYGPAAPSDVLTHLLSGLPYNFVMTQAPRTPAPQQLVISSRNSGAQMSPDTVGTSGNRGVSPARSEPSPSYSVEPHPSFEPSNAEDSMEEEPPPVQEAPAADNAQPPDSGPDGQPTGQPGNTNGTQNGPKTPEQYLEELRKMHQNATPQ
jgi:hypothetical protein